MLNLRQAISQIMDGSMDLDPVFSHLPFTASAIPAKAQHQFVHCVLQILKIL
jgi:hypothetical protein